MLDMNAIYKTDRKDLVLSSIYTVPKKNGKRRPVINLRWVNGHLHRKHFKMSTMKDVKAALTKGCYMASVDLTDCFWGLPVAEKDQRFLSFRWRGQNYSFRVLPFGLAPSPYYITKLYRHLVADLQSKGHRVIIYIDDILILGDSASECERSVAVLLDALENLGARVNYGKSCLKPTQELEYLGFLLDSREMRITAPPRKITNLHKSMKAALRRPALSARDAASLLGKLQSMADALLPVRVHTSGVHAFKLQALRQGGSRPWDRTMPLPDAARQDLLWWVKNLRALNGRPILPPTYTTDYQVATDASDYGWGAWITINGKTTSWGGLFSREDQALHINDKELLAIYYFLKSCPYPLDNKTVDFGVDNTCALAYIRRLGGRLRHLAKISDMIHDEVIQPRNISIVAHHIPGHLNVLADWESRRQKLIHPGNFQLHPELFRELDHLWGPHSIDGFATYQDRQLPRFGGWDPQPEATWTDSLRHPWRRENLWAHPPFALLGRVLQKVEQEGATITLLAPLWSAQPWFPKLVRLAIEPPRILPQQTNMFLHPLRQDMQPPQWLTVAWRISGAPSSNVGTRHRQSTWSSRRGLRRLLKTMTSIGGLGDLTAIQRAKIASLATTWRSARG